MRVQQVLMMAWVLVAVAAGAATVPEVYRQSYEQETAGYYTAALETLSRLPDLGEEGYVFQLRRGWLQYLAREYDGAVASYRQAVALAPESVEAKLGLMAPLMALHKWLDTLDVVGSVEARDPGSYLIRTRRAYCEYQLGRYAAAAAGYQAVLGDYPSDLDMRAGLGWALLRGGDASAAQREFEAVLRVSPDHASASSGYNTINLSNSEK